VKIARKHVKGARKGGRTRKSRLEDMYQESQQQHSVLGKRALVQSSSSEKEGNGLIKSRPTFSIDLRQAPQLALVEAVSSSNTTWECLAWSWESGGGILRGRKAGRDLRVSISD